MIDKLKKRLCMPEESYLFPVNKVVAAVLFKTYEKTLLWAKYVSFNSLRV